MRSLVTASLLFVPSDALRATPDQRLVQISKKYTDSLVSSQSSSNSALHDATCAALALHGRELAAQFQSAVAPSVAAASVLQQRVQMFENLTKGTERQLTESQKLAKAITDTPVISQASAHVTAMTAAIGSQQPLRFPVQIWSDLVAVFDKLHSDAQDLQISRIVTTNKEADKDSKVIVDIFANTKGTNFICSSVAAASTDAVHAEGQAAVESNNSDALAVAESPESSEGEAPVAPKDPMHSAGNTAALTLTHRASELQRADEITLGTQMYTTVLKPFEEKVNAHADIVLTNAFADLDEAIEAAFVSLGQRDSILLAARETLKAAVSTPWDAKLEDIVTQANKVIHLQLAHPATDFLRVFADIVPAAPQQAITAKAAE